nr:class E sortase [Corynebacterium sp. TAE3-ERU12]
MSVFSVLGELMVTIAVVLALFVVHQLWWTGVETRQAQDEMRKDLQAEWQRELPGQPGQPGQPGTAVPVTASGAMGYLEIPRIGLDAVFQEGVGLPVLANGPGRYPQSQLPGEVGNVAFAAHRDGNAAHFSELDKLSTCDEIIVETARTRYFYRVLPTDGAAMNCVSEQTRMMLASPEYEKVSGREIVVPSSDGVVAAVPQSSGMAGGDMQPTLPLLTLTTCHPHWQNAHRMIIHAVLEKAVDKPQQEVQ